jgi:predicted metal-dependent peptidase
MTEKAERAMQKARAALLLDAPFFGSLALRMPLKADTDLDTMATNGKEIRYNPAWVSKLGARHLKTVVAHEVMHVALSHHLRRGERDADDWNIATDYAINLVLSRSGFDMPDCALMDPQYADMNAEEIYTRVKRPKRQSGGSGENGKQQTAPDPGGMGGVIDMPGGDGESPATEAERKAAEAEIRVSVQQAAQAAKAAGQPPAGMEREIEEITAPRIPWREVLWKFVDRNRRDDYTWSPPNRRYVHMGLYLTSCRSDEIRPIVVVVDTSGSITPVQLTAFGSEITAICEHLPISTVNVLYCDSRVYDGPTVTKQDLPVTLEMRGGGGTMYAPAFEAVEERGIDPACLIYITDGFNSDTDLQAPDYPVLWAMTDSRGQKQSFGQHIYIGHEE